MNSFDAVDCDSAADADTVPAGWTVTTLRERRVAAAGDVQRDGAASFRIRCRFDQEFIFPVPWRLEGTEHVEPSLEMFRHCLVAQHLKPSIVVPRGLPVVLGLAKCRVAQWEMSYGVHLDATGRPIAGFLMDRSIHCEAACWTGDEDALGKLLRESWRERRGGDPRLVPLWRLVQAEIRQWLKPPTQPVGSVLILDSIGLPDQDGAAFDA
ncbi:MAG: hypothetical protein L6R48_18655 [Planctomycetes bacterium]|nr:hypothetical protein [Planctomycetota bacterium]